MSGIPFLFAGLFFLFAGFKPELSKLKSKKHPKTQIQTERVCEKCGKAIDPDSAFCKFCGEKQSN